MIGELRECDEHGNMLTYNSHNNVSINNDDILQYSHRRGKIRTKKCLYFVVVAQCCCCRCCCRHCCCLFLLLLLSFICVVVSVTTFSPNSFTHTQPHTAPLVISKVPIEDNTTPPNIIVKLYYRQGQWNDTPPRVITQVCKKVTDVVPRAAVAMEDLIIDLNITSLGNDNVLEVLFYRVSDRLSVADCEHINSFTLTGRHTSTGTSMHNDADVLDGDDASDKSIQELVVVGSGGETHQQTHTTALQLQKRAVVLCSHLQVSIDERIKQQCWSLVTENGEAGTFVSEKELTRLCSILSSHLDRQELEHEHPR